MRWAEAARRAAAVSAGRVSQVAARPRLVVGALTVTHWAAVLAFALLVRHNGLVYYQGGDQIGYTTTASLISDGHLPPTFVGYGWVAALLPAAWFVGPDYVSFLPWVWFVNIGLLAPLAIACVYALARRLGGAVLGLTGAALWVAAPFLAIPLFRDDYHDRYVEQFLPQALGLGGLADYPSMVCLLAAAYLTVRTLDGGGWTWAAAAGLAAGVAASLKPANLLFLAGPAAAFLLMRHRRSAVPYLAALAPSLLLLLLWKIRGLGGLPALAAPETRIAAERTLGGLGVDVGRYVDYDLDVLRRNMAGLREYFWSARLVQWIPFAGTFAVARRSLPVAALLSAWFFAFLLTKGTVTQSTVDSGTFFRLMMPSFPAYFLLFAAIPLLAPTLLRRRVGGEVAAPAPLPRRPLAAVAAVAVAVPLVLTLAPRPISDADPQAISIDNILVPVDARIAVDVAAEGGRRTVTWRHNDYSPTDVFYRVFRTGADGRELDCIGDAARECRLEMLTIASTRARRYVDESPPPGAVYRIGVATNWRDDIGGGDVIAVSQPIPAG